MTLCFVELTLSAELGLACCLDHPLLACGVSDSRGGNTVDVDLAVTRKTYGRIMIRRGRDTIAIFRLRVSQWSSLA